MSRPASRSEVGAPLSFQAIAVRRRASGSAIASLAGPPSRQTACLAESAQDAPRARPSLAKDRLNPDTASWK
eukprot:13052760-Alexandrium_andersonii.AAC.1